MNLAIRRISVARQERQIKRPCHTLCIESASIVACFDWVRHDNNPNLHVRRDKSDSSWLAFERHGSKFDWIVQFLWITTLLVGPASTHENAVSADRNATKARCWLVSIHWPIDIFEQGICRDARHKDVILNNQVFSGCPSPRDFLSVDGHALRNHLFESDLDIHKFLYPFSELRRSRG